jgi:hypothetical protein
VSDLGLIPAVTLKAKGGISDADVQDQLRLIWEKLRTNAGLREAARKAGVDLHVAELYASVPFVATRPQAEFGIAETILISVVGGELTHIAKSALDALWKSVIWPRLEQRFGADLEPAGNAGSG